MNIDERIEQLIPPEMGMGEISPDGSIGPDKDMNEWKRKAIKQLIKECIEYVKPERMNYYEEDLDGGISGHNGAIDEMGAKIEELGL